MLVRSGVGLNSFAVVTIGIGVGYSLTVNGEPVNNPDKSYRTGRAFLSIRTDRAAFPDIRDARRA